MIWVKSVNPDRRRVAGALLATSLLALGIVSGWADQTQAAAGINKQINFQGKVVNGNGTNVANGSYNFVFKIYDDPSLGGVHELWTETKSLTVTDGIFQTNLGSSTSLPGSVDFNTDNIYLGINFNSDGEMTPRIRFTAAAYAFNSERLGGLTAASFAQLSPASAQSGSLNVTGSVQAATSLQAPLVDTATAVALNIGTGTASSVTIGRTTTPFLVQGNSSSTFTATNGSFTTTVGFTTPTANNSISFPNAGGTICTTVATTCNSVYQAAGTYLAKNATDTSSAAVTASNYLYGFTNSSSAVASGVLQLNNGSNTGNGLYVTASGNPGANQALIVANNTAGSPSGNLLDLQTAGSGVFTVNYSGSLTQSGGTSTTQTINGQRISSAANFTGTVTAATSFLSTLIDTPSAGGTLAIGTTNATGGINLNQNVTVAAGKTLGLSNASGSSSVASVTTTGDTNPRLSVQASGQLAWGPGNAATDITLGRTGSAAMQGSGTWTFTGGVAVGTPSSQYGKLAVQISSAANAGIVVRGTTSQTGDLLQAQETGGAVLASIGASGALTLGRSAASGVTQTGSAVFVDSSTTNGYGATLSVAALTASRAINLPNEAGTLCIQNSANCGFVTGTSASFIQNQIAAQQATSNFWISGTGRADTSFVTTLLDTPAAGGVLAIGTTNATGGINLNQATTVASNKTFTANGNVLVQSGTNSTSSFNLKTSGGGNLLTVDTSNSRVGINLGGNTTPTLANAGLEINGALRLSGGGGTSADTFTTPVGSNVSSKINIPVYDAGAFGQVLAFGLPSTGCTGVTTTSCSARAISVFDARTLSHQPSIGVFSPDENTLVGFSWEGSNSTASVMTNSGSGSTDAIMLQSGASSGASGTSGAVTVISGDGTGTNSSSGNVLVDSGAKTGSGTNGTVSIGTGNASGVTVGRANSSVALTLQGSASSVFRATGASGTTTLDFIAPSGTNTVHLPAESGTICIQSSVNCGFVVGSSTSFLARNAADTSTINAAGNLYGLSNTNSGAAGVLSLANSGTNSALVVTSAGNPSSGQAVISATNSNGTPSGNLIDLRVTAGSRFSVDTSGNATATTSIIAPTHSTADVTTGTSADATFRSGNGTAGNASTGAVTVRSGNANGTGSSGNVTVDVGTKGGGVGSAAGNAYFGNTNAANVVIGRNAVTASGVAVSIQGLAATSNIIMNNAANTASTTIGFQAPTANVTYEYAAATVGTYQLCSTYAATCATTYAPYIANGYLAKSPTATESSSSSIAGNQYSFTNSNGGAAGVLALSNSGTNSALSVTSAANPSAGQAVILATNTNGTPSGNLLDLRVTAGSRFSVDAAGAVTTSSTINGQTISGTANFTGTVTAANTVSITTGGLSVTAGGVTVTAGGLTVSANGANISGGLNNNSGGITNAGAVSGATSLAFTGATADITGARDYTGTGTVTGGGAFKSADSTTATSSAVSLKSGDVNTATNGFNTGNVTVDSGARTGGGTGTAGAVNIGNTNASAVTVGNTSAPFTVQGTAGGSASKIIFGNTTVNAASSATVATYQFAAPSSATTYNICTSDTASCGASSIGYLRKGVAAETSSAGVSASSYLYNFSNTGGVQSDVLQLDNGAGTGSTLRVTAAASAAANNALLYVNSTLNNATGNLLDLVSTQGGVSASRLSVSTTGAITGGTFNGQTISAAASFTGTLNTAGLLTANSLTVTNAATFNSGATVNNSSLIVNAGASVTGGINNNAGTITNAGAVSGLSSLQFNTAGTIDANSAVAISIGTSQASTLNIGRAGATLSLQGNTSTSLTSSNGTNTTSLQFANPTANVIYQFATAPANTYQICTTYAATCGTTYASYYAGGYVQLAPGTAQADASANPSLFISKTAAGYLARLQNTGTDVFSVQTNGTMTSSGISYLGGTSASYVAQVDTTNFKVRIGTGTPTRGSEGANSTAGLYVSGATEAAGLVLIGTTTNGASFDATNHELTLSGTARHTRRVSLAPEYPGAVMTPSGSSNTGLMTSDFCSGSSRLSIPTSSNPCASTDEHNYYKWVSANSSTQTYDIYVRYLLPTDFSAFTGDNTIYMSGYRTTTSDSVALAIYQPNGTICGSSTNIATGTATWTEGTVTAPIATTCAANFTANSMITFRVRLTSTSTVNAAMAGEIRFDYRSIY